jgi:hypothetical protein
MLIGNRWLEHGQYQLKILNTSLLVLGGAFATATGSISTGIDEGGLIVGYSALFYDIAGTVVESKILYNGTAEHSGNFRISADRNAGKGNIQPSNMAMVPLDVPPNCTVEIMARVSVGVAGTVYFDLLMIAYQLKAFEAALVPVCFPSEVFPEKAR